MVLCLEGHKGVKLEIKGSEKGIKTVEKQCIAEKSLEGL